MTPQQYLSKLRHLRQRIETQELDADDCNIIGMKDTTCTWGFCGENSRLIQQNGQHCPMDRRLGTNTPTFGCFYECAVFNPADAKRPCTRRTPAVGGTPPTREIALALVDNAIAQAEEKIAQNS